MRWSSCEESTDSGACKPQGGGRTVTSFSATVTTAPNFASSSRMASARSLSLIFKRRVPEKRAPCFAAATAKSTGARSGQFFKSASVYPAESCLKSVSQILSPCKLFLFNPVTITLPPRALSAFKNAALDSSPSVWKIPEEKC